MRELLRSLLVVEETDDTITLRAACGSRRAALRLLWTTTRMRYLPHRLCEMDTDTLTFGPYAWYWRNRRIRKTKRTRQR